MLRHISKAFKGNRGYHTFEQGDFCMLRQVKSNKKFFVGPLEETGERGVKGGNIRHDSIIGKKPRSVIRPGNGKEKKMAHTKKKKNSCIVFRLFRLFIDSLGYMAHFPTLEE